MDAVHVVEHLAAMLKQGDIALERYRPKTVVTYHDPCVMGRWMGIYEPPRDLIEAIPGVTLAEMPRNRRDAYCCGAGGMIRYDFADMANLAGADRIAEAEGTGAEVIMSACPACLMQLQQSRQRARSKIKVMDITEILMSQLRPLRKVG
jgi:glycolate oxidase